MPSRNIFELHKAECKVTFHAETTHGESMGIRFKHLHCAPAVLRQSFPPQLSPGMAMEQPGTQKLEPNFVANDCNRITVHVSSTGSSTNTLTSKSKLWCAQSLLRFNSHSMAILAEAVGIQSRQPSTVPIYISLLLLKA